MRKAMLYVHGKGGSASEAAFYADLCPGYDVYGVEYTDSLPWQVCGQIKAQYDEWAKQYDAVSIITNSIGTYFAMLALQQCPIRKAYCISPILDMERLVLDMMAGEGISEEKLKEAREIPTRLGEVLSWEYLCYVRENPIHWTVPTTVLYAGKDNLTSRHTAETFAARHRANLTVMEEGEHWFHTPEQLDFLSQWLQKELCER